MDIKDNRDENTLLEQVKTQSDLSIDELEVPSAITDISSSTEQQKRKKPLTPFQESLRRFLRSKRSMTCLVLLLLFVLISLFGPVIYQHIGGPYKDAITGKT